MRPIERLNGRCVGVGHRHDANLPALRMNIHHLELFYHVARHGGISAAVRHMPWSIQQPALSSQIRQLETQLGVSLFERQPFRLTPAGEKLIAFAGPFFDQIDAVGAELHSRAPAQLRISASELVLRDHMPAVIKRVKQIHPGLRLVMRDGPPAQVEGLLRDREVDLAVSLGTPVRPGSGLRMLRIMQLPLVLLVHRTSRIKSAAELWRRRSIEEPLVSSVPAPENAFQQGLKRRGIMWRPAIEATSLELVTWYVANRHGIGVNIALPELVGHRDVRVLPLDDFPAVDVNTIWRGEPTPVLRTLMEEAQRYVRKNWPQFACDDVLGSD
jgi:DNA-binding transcriptional LysR family regulator